MIPILSGLFVVVVIALISVCFEEGQTDKASEKTRLQLLRQQLDELREEV